VADSDQLDPLREKSRILDLVKSLESEQILCAVAHNDIDASIYAFNYNYSFNYKLSTGNDSIVVNSYSDAVYTLSSAVTITVNSEQSQLIRNDSVTRLPSGRISFLRYMDNVYANMRIGGNEYTSRYRMMMLRALSTGLLFGLIYYFCQLFMVIIAATILIKHVFDVMNKNKEVMTLFAMIEKEQIEKLKIECNQYIRLHLTELYDDSDALQAEKKEREKKDKQKMLLESKGESIVDSDDSEGENDPINTKPNVEYANRDQVQALLEWRLRQEGQEFKKMSKDQVQQLIKQRLFEEKASSEKMQDSIISAVLEQKLKQEKEEFEKMTTDQAQSLLEKRLKEEKEQFDKVHEVLS
jgi:hypothetical protein